MTTLDPAQGLTAGWQVAKPAPPDYPLWSVAVDIGGLDVRETTADGYPLHLVGACGANRTDTTIRAAGEAVERFALTPRGLGGPRSRIGTMKEPGALDFVAASLGDPAAADQPLTWYEGCWLDTGEPVWLPAGLVDYPAEQPWFDPTPSGTAAGGDLDFALRGALLETIERDAVAVAWAADAGMSRLDVDAVATRQARELWDVATDAGLVMTLVEVATAIPNVYCVLVAAVDRTGDRTLAAVGAKAHPELGRAVLIALQESLQVRAALLQIGNAPVPDIRNDVDRARFWMTEPAVAELERRMSALAGSATHVEPVKSADTLVQAMISDGARPAMVDLTGRLPHTHQAMGWRVVKVIAPGWQPLRMNETISFGRCHDRIDAVRRRHGLTAGNHAMFPHPLI